MNGWVLGHQGFFPEKEQTEEQNTVRADTGFLRTALGLE